MQQQPKPKASPLASSPADTLPTISKIGPVALVSTASHIPSVEPRAPATKASNPMWIPFIAPGVALLIGFLNLWWNWKNSQNTSRIGKSTQAIARKMGAINPYRADVLAELKELVAQKNELISIPRSANYAGAFRPVQNRFTNSQRRLRNILSLMSLDPEIDGDAWHDCLSDPYDQFLDCCNTLLNPQTADENHIAAKQRLVGIVQTMQARVLERFSTAIDNAQRT